MDPKRPGAEDPIYRRSLARGGGDLSLDADTILVLRAVDGASGAAEIARKTRLSPAAVRRGIETLRAQGLIEALPRPPAFPARPFLQELYRALSRAIGPMARLLLEEGLAELRLDPDRLSLEQAAELAQRIALEIPNGERRLEFQQAILAVLNRATDRSRSP